MEEIKEGNEQLTYEVSVQKKSFRFITCTINSITMGARRLGKARNANVSSLKQA